MLAVEHIHNLLDMRFRDITMLIGNEQSVGNTYNRDPTEETTPSIYIQQFGGVTKNRSNKSCGVQFTFINMIVKGLNMSGHEQCLKLSNNISDFFTENDDFIQNETGLIIDNIERPRYLGKQEDGHHKFSIDVVTIQSTEPDRAFVCADKDRIFFDVNSLQFIDGSLYLKKQLTNTFIAIPQGKTLTGVNLIHNYDSLINGYDIYQIISSDILEIV